MDKANRICQLACAKRKADQEYYLFQEYVYYKKLPKLCLILGAKAPTTIKRVHDPVVRATLMRQYLKVIDRAKFDLNSVMITASAILKEHSQRELDGFMAELWLEERRLSDSDRLSARLLQLIEQRQMNVAHCIRTIYEQKMQFLNKIPIVILHEFHEK